MAQTVRIPALYHPLPTQEAFHRSKAKIRGFGGAMAGGKSRALCEEAFQAALDYPGIEIVMARKEHTAIVMTTRKTMYREVLPPRLVEMSRRVQSGGYDFIEFPNKSVIHFAGLSDIIKFMSGEFGRLIFDEAHEIDEDDVMMLNTRLRQKCASCLEARAKDCKHLPRDMLFGFNPENPGHYLYRYFIQDADRTPHGYYKAELRLEEDAPPVGASEFIQAKPTDNPYLPEGYIERELASMKSFHRRRYLEGEWLYISGSCAFDVEALAEYEKRTPIPLYRLDFEPVGIGDRARRKESDVGRTRVYAEPVEGHSYAIGADVATGRGADFSCAYVIDLADMALVAEYHAKLDADIFARDLHFLGRWYNSALLAVESAGGWGEPVIISLRDGREGRPAYPRLYRHRLDSSVAMDTMQRYGFPMNSKTRPQVLSQLERAVRERSLPYLPSILLNQCLTFCEFEEGTPSPRAQPGCHDDAVLAAAITLELYRQRGAHPEREMRKAIRKRFRRPRKQLYRPLGADL